MTSLLIAGIVLLCLAVAATGWLAVHLTRQHGRLLLRLEALEARLAVAGSGAGARPQPEGLPVGTNAPDFDLPDLEGMRHSLAEFRGRQVLLVFFNPRCGYCGQMVRDLASLPTDGLNGRALPVVVTTGNPEANRRMLREGGVRGPVLVQAKKEVAASYQVPGTPMGYLIDEQGRIASPLALGAEALLDLAGDIPATEKNPPAGHAAGANGRNGKLAKSRANSRLIRDGLKAGTAAPRFTLPRLEGGELSLDDYRGRQVLLVFSDPHCGPCEELAPQLEQLHRRQTGLEILMISRRESEANRQKAEALGLTFPIVLQQGWEISLLYGMFATPIGYLINEEGIIAADVAVGVEAIMALIQRSGRDSDPELLLAHGGNGREAAMA